MNIKLLTITIALTLLLGVVMVQADILEDIGSLLGLKTSSTTITLSPTAKVFYTDKTIKAIEVNGTTNKRTFELKVDDNTINKIDVPTKKCSKFNITNYYSCEKRNYKGVCVKQVVSGRRINGCLTYIDKSESEILSEIDSKTKYHLEKNVPKTDSVIESKLVERTIGVN